MKRYLAGAGLLCLAALWVGCQQSSAPTRPSTPSTSSSAAKASTGDAVALTLVKLKVPNMT